MNATEVKSILDLVRRAQEAPQVNLRAPMSLKKITLEHAHRDFAPGPSRRHIDIAVQVTIEPERLIDWRRHATKHVDQGDSDAV